MTTFDARLLAALAACVFAAAPAFAQTAMPEGDPLCERIGEGEEWSTCLIASNGVIVEIAYGDDSVEIAQFMDGGDYGEIRRDSREVWSPLWVKPGERDLNGDGVDEILIPTGAGNVNIEWSIWELFNEEYVPRGTLLGGTIEGFDVRDGFVITSARNNAYSYSETGVKVTSHGILTVFELDIDFSREEGSYCILTYEEGLSAYGLTEEGLLATCEAQAKAALE